MWCFKEWNVKLGDGKEPTVCSPCVTVKSCQIIFQPNERVLIKGEMRMDWRGMATSLILDFILQGRLYVSVIFVSWGFTMVSGHPLLNVKELLVGVMYNGDLKKLR